MAGVEMAGRSSAIAEASFIRFPKARMSISLRRLRSSSRRTSPVISCSAVPKKDVAVAIRRLVLSKEGSMEK